LVIEKAKQLREPALIVSWAVLVVQLIMAWVVFGRVVGAQSVAQAAALAGSRNTAFFTTFVVLLLAISTLVQTVTKNSRSLIMISGHLLMISAATSLAFMIMSMTDGFALGALLAAIGGLLDVVVKILAGVALYWTVDWGRRPTTDEPSLTSEPDDVATDGELTHPTSTSDEVAPLWQPSQATGLQWTRAGDAASGVQGSRAPAASAATGWPAMAEQQHSPAVAPQPAPAQRHPAGPQAPTANVWGPADTGVQQPAPSWQTAAQIAQGEQPRGRDK